MSSTGTNPLQNKTCLITGANSGIGKVTALALAKMGADLVLVCRDPKKGEETVAEVKAAGGGGKVELIVADLSSQASIREAVAAFKKGHDRLHVLVNNAGAHITNRKLTTDGLEATFALNHLGYFLLTNLLIGELKTAAPSRVVSVSSGAHNMGKIRFDDLQTEHFYTGLKAYSQSKLGNILFTRELARRLDGTGVTANCLHPGAVASNFGQADDNGWFKWGMKLVKTFMITPEAGAKTSIYLASSPDVEGQTGKYFIKCVEQKPAKAALDDETAAKLWKVSAELTHLPS